MPLGIAYPVHQIFPTAKSPFQRWPRCIRTDQTIQNPAFYFHRTASVGTGKLVLDYEYRSLSDVVQPEAVPTYAQQLNAVVDLLGYSISSD